MTWILVFMPEYRREEWGREQVEGRGQRAEDRRRETMHSRRGGGAPSNSRHGVNSRLRDGVPRGIPLSHHPEIQKRAPGTGAGGGGAPRSSCPKQRRLSA